MLDHRLIATISERLEKSGWKNCRYGQSAPVFTISRERRVKGDVNQRQAVWALQAIDEWREAIRVGRKPVISEAPGGRYAK